MSKSHKKKVKLAATGKISPEKVQHLRRCGVSINSTNNKRPIRRFVAWWETTTVEKFLEDVEFLLKNAAVLNIINLVASITIIISLITWLTTEKQRRNAEIYQAWQVITAAYEQTGSGGRIKALEFLNSEPKRFPLFWLKWERESLAGLAAPKAHLVTVQLPKAYLRLANLQKADLWHANLEEAQLWHADLEEAFLWGANLKKADLWKVNLKRAYLQQAYLEKAKRLTRKQIKSACSWEKAIYKGEWNDKKKTWVAKEPDNTNYINELKNDESSNPIDPPDCSIWNEPYRIWNNP